MNTNISITREHDKICILEHIIKYVSNDIKSTNEIETIVSNFIDSVILNEKNNIELYLNLLKKRVDKHKLLKIIIELSVSIAKQFPYLLTIEINDKTNNYINYINEKDTLPLF
jgi:hypothetical protein